MAPMTADDIVLIAILRGVQPERVLQIGDVLYEAGFRTLEVPLNSPDPFASIAKLAASRNDWTIGAGTVLRIEDVQRTRDAGGRLILSPNCDAEVIRASLDLAMQAIPGIATATEAFNALGAGTRQLKLFPAATYGPRHLTALRAVLPSGGVSGRGNRRARHRPVAGRGRGRFRLRIGTVPRRLQRRGYLAARTRARASLKGRPRSNSITNRMPS